MKRSRKIRFAWLGCLWLTVVGAAPPTSAQGGRNGVSAQLPQPSAAAFQPAQRVPPMRADIVPAAASLDPPDSRIGPDDLLSITVFEAPEMNTILRVSATGDISVQLLGEVHAAGLTPSELQAVLQGLLRRTYMKDPHVGVFIQELQSHAVSVIGAVKMPGVFQIRGPKTLLEILSLAQGLADDAGDTVSIVHTSDRPPDADHANLLQVKLGDATDAEQRKELLVKSDARQILASDGNPRVENINLRGLLESPGTNLNVLVYPGDVVKVSRAGIVYVVGEVNRPGGFVLQNNENISILQALALAQGTTHTSAIRDARIIRTDLASGKRTEIPVNLARIFAGKRSDTVLQPRDVVFVPNSAAKSVLYRASESALQTAAGVAIYKW